MGSRGARTESRGAREPGPVLSGAVGLVAALVLAFAALAGSVRGGLTEGFDRAVLLALRDPADAAVPLGPPWVVEMARDVTALGSYAVLGLVLLAVLGYLVLTGRRHAAWLVAAAVLGGMLLSNGLKFGFDRPRPEVVPHVARVFTPSFPSGHATLSAVTFLTLGALLGRLDARRSVKRAVMGFAVALTLLVGASRVYLGVHYPTDVLAGWCVGAAWAALCWLLARRLQRRGEVEPPSIGVQVPGAERG